MKTATNRVRGVEHDIVQTPQVGDVSPYYEPQGNEVAIFEAAYKRRLPIMLGILFATLANNFGACYAGAWLASLVSPQALRWIVAVSFDRTTIAVCRCAGQHKAMSEQQIKITLAQLNPTVGDVTGNAAKARAAREKAKADGADLVVLSELFIAGYPPEDLVLKPAFQSSCRAAIEELARETKDGGPAMLIGTPWVEDGKLYNACALLDGGRIAALRIKANLPNYGVFDEKRLFARGPVSGPVTVRGVRIGVPICEDIWLEESEDYENVVEGTRGLATLCRTIYGDIH